MPWRETRPMRERLWFVHEYRRGYFSLVELCGFFDTRADPSPWCSSSPSLPGSCSAPPLAIRGFQAAAWSIIPASTSASPMASYSS